MTYPTSERCFVDMIQSHKYTMTFDNYEYQTFVAGVVVAMALSSVDSIDLIEWRL